MSNRLDHLTRQVERSRKALAYSIAQREDAKGAKAQRRADRMARVARRQRLEALRWAGLEEA
jgi:hypothetical protein